MKRTLTTLALGAMLVGAGVQRLAAQNAAAPSMISAERARSIAIAQVPNQQGLLSEKLKTTHGVMVYEVDLETPGPGHQEVRVDAHTGTVMASSHEDDVAGSIWHGATKTADKVEDAAKDVARAADREADRVFSDDDVRRINPRISEARARAIAQERVPGAPIKDVDLETENGVLVWDLDLDTPGSGHDEVVVDATTGKVLRVVHER